jgi:putative spermidine/putrescine transport system ATP-binding protein
VGAEGRVLSVATPGLPAPGAVVALERLVKRFGPTVAVDEVSLETEAGEFLSLLGPSGCGKTTTLRCIAGFVDPDAGRVRIGGEDVTREPPYRRQIGMVFQSYALFPHLSVFENVAFGLRIRRRPTDEVTGRVEQALDLVRLGGFGGRLPKALSGGQQQRVALARALVYEPRVLLLDEPLSNLDARLRVEMRMEIRALQRRLGLTAIYVTHDQEEALSVSDRIVVMREGRIEQVGSPWEVYHRPATPFVANFVGTANVLSADVVTTQGSTVLRVGRGVDLPFVGTGRPPGRRVWVVARPETLSIAPKEAVAGLNPLLGKVATVTLLGSVLRVRVALEGEVSVLVDVHDPGTHPAFAEGDIVGVTVHPDRLVLLPRE